MTLKIRKNHNPKILSKAGLQNLSHVQTRKIACVALERCFRCGELFTVSSHPLALCPQFLWLRCSLWLCTCQVPCGRTSTTLRFFLDGRRGRVPGLLTQSMCPFSSPVDLYVYVVSSPSSLDLVSQGWQIIALFLRVERETLDPDLQHDYLGVLVQTRNETSRLFRRMIFGTTFWEYMTGLSALDWSLVEPLSALAADLVLLARHSSSTSFLPQCSFLISGETHDRPDVLVITMIMVETAFAEHGRCLPSERAMNMDTILTNPVSGECTSPGTELQRQRARGGASDLCGPSVRVGSHGPLELGHGRRRPRLRRDTTPSRGKGE